MPQEIIFFSFCSVFLFLFVDSIMFMGCWLQEAGGGVCAGSARVAQEECQMCAVCWRVRGWTAYSVLDGGEECKNCTGRV